MSRQESEYQKIIIPQEEIDAVFYRQARRYAVLTLRIGGFLFPAWALLDYTMAPEHFAQFLLIRIFVMATLLLSTWFIAKKRIPVNVAYFTGYFSALIAVAYMVAVVSKEALITYILGYSVVILVGDFFLLLDLKKSLFFFLISIALLFGFNAVFQQHTPMEILNNGGYLFLTIGIFGLGASYLHYISEKKSVINRLRIQKSNEILQQQQKALQIKNKEILLQKHAIENKNKEITDSINYAKRIQQAMLSLEDLKSKKLPEHYIFFQPRDIVSGDFYWEKLIGNHWFVCVADCTGHGVPGGFMSMLGMSLLNNIVVSENQSPADILNEARDTLLNYLHSEYDGMDISLCKINLSTNEMEWSGANNPLWVIKNTPPDSEPFFDEILNGIEIKPDKQPVGKHLLQKPFTNHHLTLEPGDEIILFSDGYADQFGGPKGKKFKYRNFKLLLNKIARLPIQKQQEIIQSTFFEWKQNYEQIDDVCVMGIKI